MKVLISVAIILTFVLIAGCGGSLDDEEQPVADCKQSVAPPPGKNAPSTHC